MHAHSVNIILQARAGEDNDDVTVVGTSQSLRKFIHKMTSSVNAHLKSALTRTRKFPLYLVGGGGGGAGRSVMKA